MAIWRLAFASLKSRRWTVLLSVFAIALSVALLLGVDKLRTDARTGFANTISGTDIIVGARTGPVQLLLYSVFRMGGATNNIAWKSYTDLSADRRVAWSVPLSLGDSHRGYPVLGTTAAYFEHYRHADARPLAFEDGHRFEDLFDVVLGARVAQELGYRPGDRLVISHGLGAGIQKHDDMPFTVSGILAPTGTAVDRTLHISLRGFEAIHVGWDPRSRATGRAVDVDTVRGMELEPRAITAFLVGLKSKAATFSYQRQVNGYRGEPLMAILPGVTLSALWSTVAVAETALGAITICVVVSALLGMMTMLLAGLNERRREMAVLRAVGARPVHILGLLLAEAAALTVAGAVLGLAVVWVTTFALADWLGGAYGLHLATGLPGAGTWGLLALVLLAGVVAGLVPAWRALRQSLADGLIVRT